MNKILRVLPAVLVVTLTVVDAQEKVAKPDSTEELLIANERALYSAIAKADDASFLSLILPEGVWTTKHGGFIPMNLLAKGLGAFQLSKWEIVNPRVTRLDENSAIVLYAWKGTGTFGDQPLSAMTVASTVWTKRGDRWLAVHHQETDLLRK